MALTPSWLYYLFAVTMLVVACYALVPLALSAVERRFGGADVELSHVAMGVSMAGMFEPCWQFGPNLMWELIFGAFLAWFTVRGIQSIRSYGLHLPHTWIHSLMQGPMLLMYWFPLSAGGRRAAVMSMTSAGAGKVDPILAFGFMLALLASAVFTLASPRKGAAVYGTHGGLALAVAEVAPAGSGACPVDADDAYLADTPSAGGGIGAALAAPVLVDLTHVLMCVAMSFMLILMV
ncbi:MAG TPA: DUF5134 domain-containing protein [Acidimicrobiales bacterium]|nr:DUF5134 domain-containing protein [Acidimicrobiales bacterium]